jgi:transcriptional regulator with XRE-family HTH domain
MNLPIEEPSRLCLRECREYLGLSQNELAAAIGFRDNGADVIRAWEQGERYGRPFAPTPLAWAALRMLVIAVRLWRSLPSGAERNAIGALLPQMVVR